MPSLNQNATIYRGGSPSIVVTVLDDAGDPVDLTGLSLFYRVSTSPGTSTLLLIQGPQITTVSNVATIPLTIAQTKDLPREALNHELYRLDGGVATLFMVGTLTVQSSQMFRH